MLPDGSVDRPADRVVQHTHVHAHLVGGRDSDALRLGVCLFFDFFLKEFFVFFESFFSIFFRVREGVFFPRRLLLSFFDKNPGNKNTHPHRHHGVEDGLFLL